MHLRTVRVLPAMRRRVMHCDASQGAGPRCAQKLTVTFPFSLISFIIQKKRNRNVSKQFLFICLFINLAKEPGHTFRFALPFRNTLSTYKKEEILSYSSKCRNLQGLRHLTLAFFPYVIFELLSLNLSHGHSIKAFVTLVFELLWGMYCARR